MVHLHVIMPQKMEFEWTFTEDLNGNDVGRKLLILAGPRNLNLTNKNFQRKQISNNIFSFDQIFSNPNYNII